MKILTKLFTKNRFKTNIVCVFKHSIVCSGLNVHFFSQEMLGEEHIPTGSHEESNALASGEGMVETRVSQTEMANRNYSKVSIFP